MSDSIDDLMNLGPKSLMWLRNCGITRISQLRKIGAVAAWHKVRDQFPAASMNLLWALAAGLEDRDWRSLTDEEKQQIRATLE